MAIFVIGLSLTAMAQKQDENNKNRPPKENPEIKVEDKRNPKENEKPKDDNRNNDNRGRRPNALVYNSEES